MIHDTSVVSLSAQRSLEDFILMREADARRALAGKNVLFSVLAPVGVHVGRGVLRVLRLRAQGERIELVCGYESYEKV